MPPNRATEASRVELCIQWALSRIEGQVYRPGMRMPSVRALARQRGVSPFTVVEAYGRLVAEGRLEARARSGFYVPRPMSAPAAARAPATIDFAWLLHHMLQGPEAYGPGVGLPPAAWLDGASIGAAVRALGREGPGLWLRPGQAQGFAPLRDALATRLAGLDIPAPPGQIVTTTGVTQGLDLALRALVAPGETVLCLDPCWFGALAVCAAHGARVVGVPMGPNGPDPAAAERLVREARPRLFILSSRVHNPTGGHLAADVARALLALARRFDFHIFEDDVYADLCRGEDPPLAARDGLERVIYAGSFSKTLASNVRVGFLAAPAGLTGRLSEAKVLAGFTTPELNERLLHKLLVEGRFTAHARQLRERLPEHRRAVRRTLEASGLEVFGAEGEGLFLWVDMGCDTTVLAAVCREKGVLVAPGALFSPGQAPSRWMRANVTAPPAALASVLEAAKALAPVAGA